MQQPPGGPPDFDPPVLVSVVPDSGTVADGLEDHLVFEFDEVISEGSGGGLARLFQVSPRTAAVIEQVEVDWRRRSVGVRPRGGWKPNVVYQVTMLRGIADLRSNQLDEGRTIIFTTGGPLPDTRLHGTVLDWETGRVGAGGIVEAVLLPDSLIYSSTADSIGEFSLTALPPGTYALHAFIDENRNGRRERREPFDSVTFTLETEREQVFWAFAQDTIGPSLREATVADSVTIKLRFAQKLDVVSPDPDAIRVWMLPDTVPVSVAFVMTASVYDSTAAAEQAVRDSLAALVADSAGAPDTTVADTAAVPPPPRPGMPGARAPRPGDRAQDTLPPSPAMLLLEERPALSDLWYVRLTSPILPDSRLLIEATARNVNQVTAESRAVLVAPAAADST